MHRLQEKVALVTGGASGLGRHIAQTFAAEGAAVVITDLDTVNGYTVATALGDRAMFAQHDVTLEADWERVTDAAIARFGKLDVLVNNAGITLMGSIESLTLEDFNRMLAVDLGGVFLGCKYAVRSMKERGGSIINISSMAGLKAREDLVGYNAAKAGVTLMTKSVALHCARQGYRIRCNSIHPGVIRTPILDKVLAQVSDPEALMQGFIAAHPIGHIGEPADVSALAVYLASSESKFVTGSTCVVDGGSSL